MKSQVCLNWSGNEPTLAELEGCDELVLKSEEETLLSENVSMGTWGFVTNALPRKFCIQAMQIPSAPSSRQYHRKVSLQGTIGVPNYCSCYLFVFLPGPAVPQGYYRFPLQTLSLLPVTL